MSLSKSIRAKRYEIKTGFFINCQLDTGSNVLECRVIDVSLSGISVELKLDESMEFAYIPGDIFSGCKLSWNEGKKELALGRVVLKSVHRGDQSRSVRIGMSLIDGKIPLEGDISSLLDSFSDESLYSFELDSNKFSLASFSGEASRHRDLFHRCREFQIFAQDWHTSQKYLYRSIREPSMGSRIKLSRRRKNGRNDYIVMGSNDYLGLASHPEVLEAAKRAIDNYGFGSTGSPMTTGLTELHEELCEKLAGIFRKDRVILYNSGFAANQGSIPALTGANDLIMADMLSHSSLQDGIRMSSATQKYFKHNDFDQLESQLLELRPQHSGTLLITEGIFSMDGDFPDLNKFVDIAKRHDCRTFLDEAHSFGVLGDRGFGAAEKFGVTDKIDIIMGTFSKICGGIGGFLAASEEVVEWLYNFSRSHMFSVSLPPSSAAAAIRALTIFQENRSLVQDLRKNIAHFVSSMKSIGCPLSENHQSAVVPVVVGNEKKLGIMLQHLLDAGVFVVPIVFPAVSRNGCRFRFTVTATHTISDLDYVVNVFESAMKAANFSFADLDSNNSKETLISSRIKKVA